MSVDEQMLVELELEFVEILVWLELSLCLVQYLDGLMVADLPAVDLKEQLRE